MPPSTLYYRMIEGKGRQSSHKRFLLLGCPWLLAVNTVRMTRNLVRTRPWTSRNQYMKLYNVQFHILISCRPVDCFLCTVYIKKLSTGRSFYRSYWALYPLRNMHLFMNVKCSLSLSREQKSVGANFCGWPYIVLRSYEWLTKLWY